MGTKAYWFDAINNDITYNAQDLRDLFAAYLRGDGVITGLDNELAVSFGTGMEVLVATGGASLAGGLFLNQDTDISLTVPPADPSLPRIDRVVIRMDTDQAQRSITASILEGAPSSTPSAPLLTRTGTIYEISLAQYTVSAGATAPTNLVDERADASLCGYTPTTATVIHRGTQRDLEPLDNLIDGVLDPTTGHKHTGAAGDGPKVDSPNITYTSGVSGFAPADVKAALDALAGVRIVEKGSNANGEYVRWENGLQITFQRISLTGAITTDTGNGAYRSTGASFMLPAAFVGSPIFVATRSVVGGEGNLGVGFDYVVRGTSSIVLAALSNVAIGASNTYQADVVGIGAWK